MNELEDIYDR